MGLFGLGKKDNTPEVATPVAAAPVDVNPGKLSLGKISLEKGQQVTIEKTALVKATCTWSSSTDYDIYALVLLRDGRTLTVSQFGSEEQPNFTPSVLNGAVKHLGDVGRGAKGDATEIIEITMTDEIEAVIPVAYSAQSNGTGSFRRYAVSLGIDNGAGSSVTISSKNASDNDMVYSVAIGVIRNTPQGIQVEALEEYSKAGSEFRPLIVKGRVVMDKGSRNLYK